MKPGSEKCESVRTFACLLRSPSPAGISGMVRNSMPARRNRKIMSQRPPEGCIMTRPLICRSGNSSFVSSVRLCSMNWHRSTTTHWWFCGILTRRLATSTCAAPNRLVGLEGGNEVQRCRSLDWNQQVLRHSNSNVGN
uniref:Uncharacterized protein n=1 Tax=Anopheles atroparvus TaxID=41427 RepID=A0A182JFV8_ANOAO